MHFVKEGMGVEHSMSPVKEKVLDEVDDKNLSG
jgi:hypothetical protein